MAYVIVDTCIDVKDGVCVDVCPVDCIYEGGRMFYIQPDECIDCAICVSVCPVDAIWHDQELSGDVAAFTGANAEFFQERVTGWGRPGGAGDMYRTSLDHPLIAGWPAQVPD